MGKNTTNSTKAAAPAKRAAKPSNKNQRAADPAVITPPAKSAAPKNGTDAAPKSAGTKRASKPATTSAPAYTDADVSLRAYFIAEKRMAAGLPGDSDQDWLEAERQLMAEAAASKKPKPARKA
jgi:hypothetical protein